MPKKNQWAQVYKSRNRSGLRIRWLDDVLEDLRRMHVRRYTEMTRIGVIGEHWSWKPGLTMGCSGKEEEVYLYSICSLVVVHLLKFLHFVWDTFLNASIYFSFCLYAHWHFQNQYSQNCFFQLNSVDIYIKYQIYSIIKILKIFIKYLNI